MSEIKDDVNSRGEREIKDDANSGSDIAISKSEREMEVQGGDDHSEKSTDLN